jgi:dihydrofolate reductase
MSRIIVDVTVSLDGFLAGPNVRPEEPMGDGGERLHDWMGGKGPEGEVDAQVVEEMNAAVGATIVGRRTFDLGVKNWGGTPWPNTPSFVITRRPRGDLRGDNGGTFAFGGLEEMVRRARDAAGGKDAFVLGGEITRALIRAGLADELWLHIAPILLGGGTRLFEGEQPALVTVRKPIATSAAHFQFRLAR